MNTYAVTAFLSHKDICFSTKDILVIKKNPAKQDSPPAAGRFSDITPLRRSVLLPGGLFVL
jgi:hypothetical protein